ncbi:MAG: dTDP-4-dehydrorhamnose 3,5-epimerase family protein [Candidatus Omnitrophota bacterium]|nr:dTDP-4-dehydrorhamnose 3,5-epimerase family protein [Candidatus Omnitrophota bacterium]
MIEGVMFKDLATHPDERGFFREIIRVTDDLFKEGFGQLSVSRIHQGVIKAWHIHKKQVDWWYVAGGVLRVALYDTRKDSATVRETMELLMGDGQPARVLKIPAGVAHGYKCIKAPADIFYITSRVYDGTDEGRIAYDDVGIGYDWNL